MNWPFETLKLIRSRRPIVAAAAMALFVGLMLLGFYTYAKSETGGRAEFRYTFENENYFNPAFPRWICSIGRTVVRFAA